MKNNQNACLANNAASKCIGVETDERNTVVKRAAKKPIASDEKPSVTADTAGDEKRDGVTRHGDMLTQHNDEMPATYYNPEGFERQCNQCGVTYTAKRGTSKYCSTRCRVAAYAARKSNTKERNG